MPNLLSPRALSGQRYCHELVAIVGSNHSDITREPRVDRGIVHNTVVIQNDLHRARHLMRTI
jgi:hypothetical protein